MFQKVCARDHCGVPWSDRAGRPQRKRVKGFSGSGLGDYGSLRITSVPCRWEEKVTEGSRKGMTENTQVEGPYTHCEC